MIRKISKKKQIKLKAGKSNHGYPQLKDRCEICRINAATERSHLVKKNHVHKSWVYDYDDPANWYSSCRVCHSNYELFPTKAKNDTTVTRQDLLRSRGLWTLAARVDRLIGERTEC